MYSHRNHSESLLTQPFHPPADELVDQGFIQDQLQQQPPYGQEQLDDINFNTSQLMLSSNAFALQALDGSMPQSALPAEWPLYSDALTGMADATVYDADLMTDNQMISDPSWQLISSQQTSQLAESPTPSLSNNPNMIVNDQLPRAQTPGPHPRINAPHYLHMRRRSLSADNIHALAKYQARKTAFGNQQQSTGQFDRSQFARTQTVAEVIETEDQLQSHGIKLEQQAAFSANMVIDPQITSNGNCQANDNEQQPLSSNSPHTSNPSTPDEQIKHAQKQSEYKFKIRLDKKPQKMPNIHVAATTPNILSAAQSRIMMPSVISALSSGMELGSSISTPSTPTFSPDNGSHVDNKPSAPPRRGHTRKRSLSAPQAFNPQGIPGAMPLQSVQPFPFNVSPTPRRINALPIQIARTHKNSYNSTPMSSEEYQRKLDEELEKVDFEDITVSELKDMLRQRGKPATGKKAVLMQRLQEEMDHLKAKQNQQQQNKQNHQNSQNQPNQQQQAVKPKPQQLGNTGNINLTNGQFGQMISSPTSPSGISLQHSLGNLHISSPPAHSRRYSPYTSVSIPNSPRMHPNRASAGFNGGSFPFNEDWQFNNAAIPSPGFVGQANTPMDEQAVFMLMMDNQQTSPQQDYFGPQEPSSAPATTTEFDPYQTPSSAPATTTEFEGFQQSAQSAQTVNREFVDPLYMNMDVPIGMMDVNYNDDRIFYQKFYGQ
ncbi:10317_t:CDS:1 [Paraglomus occultum]|uniref:10317_t:CDS:1 n=1 Tax=Paraglomus occultum TaxID=144539 RepID=A0A9N8YZ77_9GLOM|nr:10317_t:CDS:1 [Paraglomus occultum]